MKTTPLKLLTIAALLTSCSTGVVPMGKDTYMISGMSPGMVSAGGVRAKLLREANRWCAKRGLAMVPLSYSGQGAVIGQRAANAEIIFRAVPPNDPENKRPNPERQADYHEVITTEMRPSQPTPR